MHAASEYKNDAVCTPFMHIAIQAQHNLDSMYILKHFFTRMQARDITNTDKAQNN